MGTPVKGGKRPGAGRKPGNKMTRTKELAERYAAEGETPLQFLLKVMRAEIDPDVPAQVQAVQASQKFQAAVAAAPYMHPRLSTVTATQQISGSMSINLVNEFDG